MSITPIEKVIYTAKRTPRRDGGASHTSDGRLASASKLRF